MLPKKLLLLGGLSVLLTSCSSETSYPVHTYPMGERVSIGKLIYTAFETQWMPQLGEGAGVRIPQHRYLLLRVSITNSGPSEVMSPAITLLDDAGETYSELSGGEGVPQWIGLIRQIKPTDSAQGNLLFDVAPKHYKLRVTDETEQRAALIDIPLSFGSETPDIPGAQPTDTAPRLSSPGARK